jgi:response regulator of citrate/malate metabolism
MNQRTMSLSPRYVILDDDIFALAITTNIVRNHSRRAEVVSFSVCKDALKYIEADFTKPQYPDTVFLTDLHMPEIDDFALLDRLEKSCEAIRDRLHIFVLSAAACPDEIRKVLSYACVTGFYSKPFSFDKMNQLVTWIQHPH